MTDSSRIIVAHPDFPFSQELLKELIDKPERQIAEIEKATLDSQCSLCGKITELTEEHTPSRKAYNFNDGISFRIDSEPTLKLRQPVWSGEHFQGGSRKKSLCMGCNNKTGNLYNPEYLRFVRACKDLSKESDAGKQVRFSATLRPARIIKQGLTTIIATCQSGLLEKYPQIRNYLLNREEKGELGNASIHIYMRANKGIIRQSGVALMCNWERRQARVIAEFSAWPVGWLLILDKEPFEGALDVTSWLSFGYDERVPLEIDVPCQWAAMEYPADFRDPRQVKGITNPLNR